MLEQHQYDSKQEEIHSSENVLQKCILLVRLHAWNGSTSSTAVGYTSVVYSNDKGGQEEVGGVWIGAIEI